MTENTKSLLKSTILGLIGGGAISSLYALKNSKDEAASDSEFAKDEISVPLSRRTFLKAVRPERLMGTSKLKKLDSSGAKDAAPDTSAMSPKDLAALKKAILRKNAEECCSSKIKSVTSPSSHEAPVRNVAGAGSTFLRDKKGRFKSEGDLDKKAGIISRTVNTLTGGALDDAGATFVDTVGLAGGAVAGLAAVKMISDRILINKKKKQVEKARKRYVDMLAHEVNDEDLPYYSKSASDRGTAGNLIGLMGVTGVGLGTVAGMVMYRIMENRRKLLEKAKDKDLASYPVDKSINFTFPKDPGLKKQSFFDQRRR